MANTDLIGLSPKFLAVLDQVSMVAPVDTAVLLCGETGTGKEVIARAIHNASPRQHSPFVALNCAAIPSGLLESELFGHERGAFTGAVTQTMGRFQAANRGTLFLDEIGDLPLELQPKLLRVLQEQKFERIGSRHTTQVDVRVIAATNQDLETSVRERKFRADLYYRLNVFPMILPPLRERVLDIPLLVDYFVRKFSASQGKEIDRIPEETMQTLVYHDWPGNIRELQNVLERAVIMSSGPELTLAPFERARMGSGDPRAATQTLADAERKHITGVLTEVGWVVGGRDGAAARLGLARTTLIHRMQKLGIVRRRAAVPVVIALSSNGGALSTSNRCTIPLERPKINEDASLAGFAAVGTLNY